MAHKHYFCLGKGENFFNLREYKEDLGLAYSRITLYLCSVSDIVSCEASERKTEKEANSDSEGEVSGRQELDKEFSGLCYNAGTSGCASSSRDQEVICESVKDKREVREKLECPTCHLFITAQDIAVHADLCAETANRRAFVELIQDLPAEQPAQEASDDITVDTSKSKTEDLTLTEILNTLLGKLCQPSRINVRRGQLFLDYVEVCKRCSWLKPENKLKVAFIGEPAEDTGGPRREFLTGICKNKHKPK